MPELRRDPIFERWVIIAEKRALRPGAFTADEGRASPAEHDPVTRTAGTACPTCPFCRGNEGQTPPEVYSLRDSASAKSSPDWRVRVVPNKFPALDRVATSTEEGEIGASSPAAALSSAARIAAVGLHEVIIDTPRHVTRIAELTDAELADSWLAIRERLQQIAAETSLKHVLVFKNVGRLAGASIEHLHSQLMATEFVPPAVEAELRGSRAFFEARGRCAYCDMLEAERNTVKRIVAQSSEFVALCPYASRFPYEILILPRRHASRFEAAPLGDLNDLAALARPIIAKIERLSQPPAYNLILHTSPFDSAAADHYHWHIEIIPRLTIAAGFEWGSGCFVNPVSPERAAEYLRGES